MSVHAPSVSPCFTHVVDRQSSSLTPDQLQGRLSPMMDEMHKAAGARDVLKASGWCHAPLLSVVLTHVLLPRLCLTCPSLLVINACLRLTAVLQEQLDRMIEKAGELEHQLGGLRQEVEQHKAAAKAAADGEQQARVSISEMWCCRGCPLQ